MKTSPFYQGWIHSIVTKLKSLLRSTYIWIIMRKIVGKNMRNLEGWYFEDRTCVLVIKKSLTPVSASYWIFSTSSFLSWLYLEWLQNIYHWGLELGLNLLDLKFPYRQGPTSNRWYYNKTRPKLHCFNVLINSSNVLFTLYWA